MVISPFHLISYKELETYFKGCFTRRKMQQGDLVLLQYGYTLFIAKVIDPGTCKSSCINTCSMAKCTTPLFSFMDGAHCPKYSQDGEPYYMCKVLKNIELFKETYATLLVTGVIKVDNQYPKGWIVEI